MQSGVIAKARRRIYLCPTGTPDILATIWGRAVFFETKAGKKGATDEQLEMHARLRRAGALVFVVNSVTKGLEIASRIQRKGGHGDDVPACA